MAFLRVANFQIEVAPNGGFIQGQTIDGRMFKHMGLQFPTTAAITAVLAGPDPVYDHDTKVFKSYVSLTAVAPIPTTPSFADEPTQNFS